MKEHSSIRRHFMKASIALPLLGQGMMQHVIASTPDDDRMLLPNDIHRILLKLYGDQANHIIKTNKLQLKSPAIAENGAVVRVDLLGEKGLVRAASLFVISNQQPLVETITLSAYVDLPLVCRIRMERSSDIILVAQTQEGLLGVKQHTKVYLGGDSCA